MSMRSIKKAAVATAASNKLRKKIEATKGGEHNMHT